MIFFFYITAASKRWFPPLSAEMLKFLASPLSCKTYVKHLRIAEQRVCQWCENSKKRGKTERKMARPWQNRSERSSGSLNCLSFLTGLGIKAKSTKCQSAILISELIHLASCVKFNPWFNPWIVLIELRGTEFNRIDLLRGLGQFNRGLALIGFRTTGTWCLEEYSDSRFNKSACSD